MYENGQCKTNCHRHNGERFEEKLYDQITPMFIMFQCCCAGCQNIWQEIINISSCVPSIGTLQYHTYHVDKYICDYSHNVDRCLCELEVKEQVHHPQSRYKIVPGTLPNGKGRKVSRVELC